MGTYNIGMSLILIASLVILAIGVIIITELPSYKNDKKCLKKSLLKDLATLNKNGFETLCKEDCTCKYTSPLLEDQ